MKNKKIYIAGHHGMVGSAIYRALQNNGYKNLVGRPSQELDLRNQAQVKDFFAFEKPELDKLYTRFLLMADERKQLNDEDLKELVG